MRRLLLVVATSLLMAPAPAGAADPARWTLTGTTSLPIVYWQGVTVDPQRNLYFDGVFLGLYRTDPALGETARNDAAIPPDVRTNERYNHIGDLSWDAREGGRLLLPLECYYPGQPNGGNTCGTASIGVADPQTLQWRYYVKLDTAEIAKAMWSEVSPGGSLIWTSSGYDLLAYRTDDVTAGQRGAGRRPDPGRAPAGGRRPAGRDHGRDVRRRPAVRRHAGRRPVPGLVDRPHHGGPGARDRAGDRGRVRGPRDGERERRDAAVAGAAGRPARPAADLRPQPLDAAELPPRTARSARRPAPRRARRARGTRAAPSPPPPAGSPRVRLLRRSRATVLRQRGFSVRVSCPAACTVRIVVRARGRIIARGTARHSGTARVRLTAAGRRILRDRARPLRLTLRITVRDAAGKVTRRTARARLR